MTFLILPVESCRTELFSEPNEFESFPTRFSSLTRQMQTKAVLFTNVVSFLSGAVSSDKIAPMR